MRSSPNCRLGQPGCFELGALYFQRAQAVEPTGFGWFCLCGFAPLRFVWSIRSGAGVMKTAEKGQMCGTGVRTRVEVSEARNEEEAEERTMDSLRSGAN